MMTKETAPKQRRKARKDLPKAGMRKFKQALGIAGSLLVVILIVAYYYTHWPPRLYYIAYVGRDQGAGFDDLHEAALKQYLDEFNAEPSGVRLELKRFSNRVDQKNNASNDVYERIIGDDRFIAVIDNTWGSELRAVADKIRDNRLPVISINADKQDIDYAQNAVFLGYEDGIPQKVVAYSNKLFNKKKPIFIAERSYRLTDQYLDQFERLGIEPTSIYVTDHNVDDGEKDRLFAAIDSALAKPKLESPVSEVDTDKSVTNKAGETAKSEPIPPVIINTHGAWGNEIIHHIDTINHQIIILGGPYIINWKDYKDKFDTPVGQNQNNNKLILFTYPTDAVTKKVFNDLKKIKLAIGGALRDDAQLYVKRCLDAVAIIRAVLLNDRGKVSDSNISRENFINYFHDKLAQNEDIATLDDFYSFDKELLLSDQRRFEQHYQGEVSSCMKQLNPAGDKEISNIYFGLDNITISKIDVEHSFFHADFYYWITYPKDETELEKHVVFRNQINESDPKRLVLTDKQDNERFRNLYKISSDFSLDADFGHYPFDSQELTIEVDLVSPTETMTISMDRETLSRTKEMKEFHMNEWATEGFYITVDNLISNSFSTGANPQYRKTQKFKSVNVRIPISRRWTSPIVTIVLPLFIIGLAAIALLYVKDSSFANIGEVCVGVFLSIVTYSIAFSQITPRTNVLTIADRLFYGTFFTVLLIFLKFIFFNSNVISERVQNWKKARSSLIGHITLTSYCLMIAIVLISGLI